MIRAVGDVAFYILRDEQRLIGRRIQPCRPFNQDGPPRYRDGFLFRLTPTRCLAVHRGGRVLSDKALA